MIVEWAIRCAALVSILLVQPAQANCRQALALGLDVSASVDLREYRLQLDGLISALNDQQVVDALLAMPGNPVTIMVFEWSGREDHATLVPWTTIDDRQTLADISTQLSDTKRRVATPGTALGVAMEIGAAYLDDKKECARRTLDISGDGESNLGPRPRDVKDDIGARGITINALVIGEDNPNAGPQSRSEIGALEAYFRSEVITGPGAFVQSALGFEDYAAAMTEKLRREIDGLSVSALQ